MGTRGDRPHELEHHSGQVSFEAAERLAPALSLGLFPGEERSRRSVHASLGDGEPMQSAVELTVALAVQAMALLLARGGIKRGDTGELRELGVPRCSS
jgi:hypothetical protein